MAEYIEREAAIESLPVAYDSAINALRNVPAADVAPVVHGRWIEQEDPMLDVYYTCSVCKEDFYIETTGYPEKDMFLYTYCPNCGAKMDGDTLRDVQYKLHKWKEIVMD